MKKTFCGAKGVANKQNKHAHSIKVSLYRAQEVNEHLDHLNWTNTPKPKGLLDFDYFYLINQSINVENVGHFFSLDFKTCLCCTFAQSGKKQKCKNAHDRSKTFNSRGNLAIAIDWFCEECKKEETLTFACFEF